MHNCIAVALTGLSAAFASFQQQQVSLPPDKNVDSVVFSLLAAVQFGGSIAICDRSECKCNILSI